MFGIIQELDNTLAVDKDNRTYTTLGYANGPGGLNGPRQDLRNVNTSDKDFLQQATVLTGSENHGSEDVGENWTKNCRLLNRSELRAVPSAKTFAMVLILMIFLSIISLT